MLKNRKHPGKILTGSITGCKHDNHRPNNMRIHNDIRMLFFALYQSSSEFFLLNWQELAYQITNMK